MEQRWSMRRQVSGRARVSCPDGVIAQARVEDVSLGGVGVVAGWPLPPGTRVRVAFTLDQDTDRTAHTVPALVAHGDGNRTGLVFLDTDVATLRALRAVLADAPPVNRPWRRNVA